MDIHEFYNETFNQFLEFMRPNELRELIHDIGMRVFNDEMIQNDDYRTNILWTKNGNMISSYDIYPSDLTFPSQENAEKFIDSLNKLLDEHPGYIELNEFYETYNKQIRFVYDCFVPANGVSVCKVITNPVDTVVGFLLDKDLRIDKNSPTEGITESDSGKVIHKKSNGQYYISFSYPTDISKQKVAHVYEMKKDQERLDQEKKARKRKR